MFKLQENFDDPTPNGIINQRLITHLSLITQYVELSENEKKALFDLLILIGKKLASVWLHYQKYASLEDQLIEEAEKKPITSEQRVIKLEHSQELFFEFDEFLVQVKSCLDYLVKIPAIFIGPEKWGLRTFASKGEDVIKALQNNVPAPYKEKAKVAIDFIKKSHQWLGATIKARDKINHFIDGGINFEYFTVCLIKDADKKQLRIPMWSNKQSIRSVMDVIWSNLFRLCEDLIGIFIWFRMKKGYAFFHGASDDMDSVESPWKVKSKEQMDDIVRKGAWNEIELWE